MTKKLKYGCLVPLGVFAVLVLALVVYVAVNMRDEPPPDDSDLALPPAPVVADKDNAWYWFNEATNHPKQAVSYSFRNAYCTDKPNATNEAQKASLRRAGMRGYEGGTSNDIAYLDEIFATNAAFLACMERGAACEHYVLPRPLSPLTSVPQISPPMAAACLWRIRATRCQRAGDWAGAFAAVSNIVRTGRLLMEEGCSTLSLLVGYGIEDHAMVSAKDLTLDPRLPPVLLDDAQDLLPTADRVWAAYDLAIRGDHEIANGAVALLSNAANRGWLRAYALHPNAVRRFSAELRRRERANAKLPCDHAVAVPAALAAPFEDESRSFSNMLARAAMGLGPAFAWWKPNGIGLGFIVSNSADPRQDGGRRSVAYMLAGFTGCRLMIACQRYKRDTGAYPKALKDLVPKYLAAVPADPYDGEPMRYDAATGKIWSRMFETHWYRAAFEKNLTFQLPK